MVAIHTKIGGVPLIQRTSLEKIPYILNPSLKEP
jgi:hypothetical protein